MARLEHIAKAKKKKGAVIGSTKDAAKGLVPRSSGRGNENEDDGASEDDNDEEDTGWKNEILFGRRKDGKKGDDGATGHKSDKEGEKGCASGANRPSATSAGSRENAVDEEGARASDRRSQNGDAVVESGPDVGDPLHLRPRETREDGHSSLGANMSKEHNGEIPPLSPLDGTAPSSRSDDG